MSVIQLSVNAGQTLTAIPVGAAAWAGDEVAVEVTATEAQTADPGKTLCTLTAISTVADLTLTFLAFSLFLPAAAEC